MFVANFRRYANRAPTSFGEAVLAGATGIPTTGAPGSTFANPITGETFVLVIPGLVAQGPRGRVVSPAAVNFFRPSGPNYFLTQSLGCAEGFV